MIRVRHLVELTIPCDDAAQVDQMRALLLEAGFSVVRHACELKDAACMLTALGRWDPEAVAELKMRLLRLRDHPPAIHDSLRRPRV